MFLGEVTAIHYWSGGCSWPLLTVHSSPCIIIFKRVSLGITLPRSCKKKSAEGEKASQNETFLIHKLQSLTTMATMAAAVRTLFESVNDAV